MTFQTMDYFLTVVEYMSFTKAAAELNITQQTLSTHIANLEDELGCQLFVRHIPLELTYAGENFIKYAESIQSTYTQLKREFADISGNQKGLLRIGVAHTRGKVILPNILAEFKNRNPHIAVVVKEDTNEGLWKRLDEGTVDIVIANDPKKMAGIELEDFYSEKLLLFVSKKLLDEFHEKDVKLEDLKDCPFLLDSSQDIVGRVARNILAKASIVPEIPFQSDNIETLMSLCAEGCGACFCPQNIAESFLSKEIYKDIKTIGFDDPISSYPICLGYKSQNYTWSIIRSFIEVAREMVTL